MSRWRMKLTFCKMLSVQSCYKHVSPPDFGHKDIIDSNRMNIMIRVNPWYAIFYAEKSTWWRKLSCDEIKTYHVSVKQNKIKKQWNANIIRSSLQFLSFVKSSFNLLMSYVFVNETHYLRCYYQWNYMGIN